MINFSKQPVRKTKYYWYNWTLCTGY